MKEKKKNGDMRLACRAIGLVTDDPGLRISILYVPVRRLSSLSRRVFICGTCIPLCACVCARPPCAGVGVSQISSGRPCLRNDSVFKNTVAACVRPQGHTCTRPAASGTLTFHQSPHQQGNPLIGYSA